MTEHLVFLSIPGLRPGDIERTATPTLHAWGSAGVMLPLTPTFPCVTSPVQASMLTGRPPREHGVIANGFYHRDRDEVEFWVARNRAIAGAQTWDLLRARRPAWVSAAWHAQNIKDAGADFLVTPSPIHEDDGTTKLWCYSKPEALYPQLLADLGHFPLQHYWGPLANIESTQWILKGAAWLIDRHAPNYHWIYLPHLDYAAQKFGPDSPQAKAAVADLDRELAAFAARVADQPAMEDAVFLAAGEYALTPVVAAVYPNRLLREAGLLAVREDGGGEVVDLKRSRAFAMVDHQFAHVYIRGADPAVIRRVVELFKGVAGVAGAHAGLDRAALGMDHERCGEVVLVSADDHWFAYYWWQDDARAPAFARTVDIHRKPGYDPVELFFDPKTKSIPLDAGLVKGSHGAPAVRPGQQAALVCSRPIGSLKEKAGVRDVDVQRVTFEMMGV